MLGQSAAKLVRRAILNPSRIGSRGNVFNPLVSCFRTDTRARFPSQENFFVEIEN
jgi:hypothetical protein